MNPAFSSLLACIDYSVRDSPLLSSLPFCCFFVVCGFDIFCVAYGIYPQRRLFLSVYFALLCFAFFLSVQLHFSILSLSHADMRRCFFRSTLFSFLVEGSRWVWSFFFGILEDAGAGVSEWFDVSPLNSIRV